VSNGWGYTETVGEFLSELSYQPKDNPFVFFDQMSADDTWPATDLKIVTLPEPKVIMDDDGYEVDVNGEEVEGVEDNDYVMGFAPSWVRGGERALLIQHQDKDSIVNATTCGEVIESLEKLIAAGELSKTDLIFINYAENSDGLSLCHIDNSIYETPVFTKSDFPKGRPLHDVLIIEDGDEVPGWYKGPNTELSVWILGD